MTSARDKLQRLVGRVPARCFWLDLPSPMAAEIAGRAGPELCVVDTEHGQIGPETLADMLRALDAGAAGIIVPYVETVEEAKAAVHATFAPPLGARGMATAVTRAGLFGADAAYAREWNARGLLVLQIETAKGLAAAAEIAAVEGVDMLFFGPSDFAADRGLDMAGDGDGVMAGLREMAAAARAAGKLAGAFPWRGADPARLLGEGVDLVAAGSDVRALAQGLAAGLGACPLPGA